MMYDFDQKNGSSAGAAGAPQINAQGIFTTPQQSQLTAQGLFDMQTKSNMDARSQNQANYDEAKGFMLGIVPGYDKDPMNTGARGLAAGLMADPEALNDQTQQKIINRAKAAVDAQMNAQLSQGRDLLASSGQMSTGNMQALQDRVAKQRIAALTDQATGLDVQRANQRNADIGNAVQMGSGLAGQRANLNLGVGQAWQLPQVLPDNYAGMAALLNLGGSKTGLGYGGSGGGPMTQNSLKNAYFTGMGAGAPSWSLQGYTGPTRDSPGQTGFGGGVYIGPQSQQNGAPQNAPQTYNSGEEPGFWNKTQGNFVNQMYGGY
jgi:hypothetical protein